MKKLLLFTVSVALVQVYGSAAPCTTESLAKYIALGSAGCVLGNLQVADFAYHAKASGGAAEITADQITVSPLLAPVGSFALQFSAPWDVQSGQDQFSGIAYHVVASSTTLPVQEVRLDGNGFKVGQFGGVVINEALATPAATHDLQVYEVCDEVCRSKTSATLNLSPGASTLVVTDAVALKSDLGSASLTSFADWFVVCIPCV
jgi:hypothetical protein